MADLKARGWVEGDRVMVDWGDWVRLMDLDAATAFKFADMFRCLAYQAERNATGIVGMTVKELERFEEGFVSPRHRVLPGPPNASER